MNKQPSRIGLYLILIALLVGGYFYLNSQVSGQNDYTIEALEQAAEEGRVNDAVIYQNREVPTGSVAADIENEGQKRVYVTDVKDAQEVLESYNIYPEIADVGGKQYCPAGKGCSSAECVPYHTSSSASYRRSDSVPVPDDEQTDVRRRRKCQNDELWQKSRKDDASGRQKSNISECSRTSGRKRRSG